MNLISQLESYKEKLAALGAQAAKAEDLQTQLTAALTEKDSLQADYTAKEQALLALNEKATGLEQENQALKADIAQREADKQASDAKAMEIVASLGLQQIPVITVTETAPTAESIRAKYNAISDPTEKGRYFLENRNAILNGVIE